MDPKHHCILGPMGLSSLNQLMTDGNERIFLKGTHRGVAHQKREQVDYDGDARSEQWLSEDVPAWNASDGEKPCY